MNDVAQTLTFGESGFSVTTDPSKPGTNNLGVVQSGATLQGANTDGSTISHLEVVGNTSTNRLELSSSAEATVARLQSQLGAGEDVLKITGNTQDSEIRLSTGNDRFFTTGQLRGGSTLIAGDGDDVVRFRGPNSGLFESSSVFMGEGDDILVFGGVVRDSNVNLGTGADSVRFNGNAFNTVLNLGGDADTDTVRLSPSGNYETLRIVGADSSDVLFIGSAQYSYITGDNEWVNINDPTDVRTFNG